MAARAPVNDAADYARPFAAKPQPLTLEQAARITPPAQATDTEGLIDVPRMRAWRRNRLREQIAAHGLDAVVLVEPLSIRYATGVRNCALFQMHIQAGYLFMPADGPVIYFDSQPGRETGRQLETIDEVRDDLVPLSYMFSGHRQREKACQWAAQIGDLIATHCGAGARIGVDRAGFHAEQALIGRGFTLADAAPALAHARKIKCPEEILAMNLALAAAEDGMTRMRAALRNGIAEQTLWALMWLEFPASRVCPLRTGERAPVRASSVSASIPAPATSPGRLSAASRSSARTSFGRSMSVWAVDSRRFGPMAVRPRTAT